MNRVGVLVTVFNRVETTIRGLRQLTDSLDRVADVEYSVFLVNDGSTDETVKRVTEVYPNVHIVEGSGSLYWSGGMARAYAAARGSRLSFDSYLLFNDDVAVEEQLCGFFSTFDNASGSILVGQTVSTSTGEPTYGGFDLPSRIRPLKLRSVLPERDLTPVDTFNGNFVLFPAKVFESLNGVDGALGHGYGDIDLGLRAKAAGTQSLLYATPIGTCDRGPTLHDRIRAGDIRRRFTLAFRHPFGIGPYFRYVARHGIKLMVPIYLVSTLIKRITAVLTPRRR